MSINVNDKNLGHATAYAYYKAGGGTMTEAEFTEFMADFGTASQTAVEAAQAALASKNAAQTAATTATTKASEATTAAQTATTKAGEASQSASTATSAKDTAVSAASTATTKATEATTAAATAISAATTATTAKDDAVSAKTAAQTAQTGAETAAASVEASAEQIATNTSDISELKEDLTVVEGAIFKKYSLSDLSDNGTYINTSGKKVSTSLQLTSGPMLYAKGLQKVILSKISDPMTGLSVAFYRKNTFDSSSFISGYVSPVKTEEGTPISAPDGTEYVAFGSRINESFGTSFSATLVFNTTDTVNELQVKVSDTETNVSDLDDKTEMLYDFVTEDQIVIEKPTSTTSTTNASSIFAISKLIDAGYYNISFTTNADATLYIFEVEDLSDTALTLEQKITKSPENGIVNFESIHITNKCIIGLSGRIGYKPSPSNGYYNVSVSNDVYTKSATVSGKVDFNIEVSIIYSKINADSSPVFGIPYIAVNNSTRIKLIGDSITQGSGSTGYVEFTLNGNIYRGNAPDYPDAGSDYQIGKFLGTKETVVHWYEALDGSGWGQLIKSYFEEKFNCTVKNYGMGGATTSDILRCWNNIMDADDDIVILMIGTNDRKAHNISTYYSEMSTIVTNLLAENKKVIVMSPPPILSTVDANSQYFHMEDACNYSSAVAYNKECQFIDNFGYFEEYCDLKGVSLNTLINNDGIHPNDNGYRVLFNHIVRQLGLGRKGDGATW